MLNSYWSSIEKVRSTNFSGDEGKRLGELSGLLRAGYKCRFSALIPFLVMRIKDADGETL
jgi:hypothetical protein